MDLNFRKSCRAKDNGLSFSTAASGVSNMLNTLNNYSKEGNNPWSHLSDMMFNENHIVFEEMNGMDNSFQLPKSSLPNPLVQAVSASVSAVQKAIMNPAMKGLEYQLNGPQGFFPCAIRRNNLFQPPGTSLPFIYGKVNNEYNQQSFTYTQCPIPEENFLSLYPPLESFHSNIEMLSYPFPYCSGTSQNFAKQVPRTGSTSAYQSWSKQIPSSSYTRTSPSSSKPTKSYKLNPEAPEYIPKMMRLSEEESKMKPVSDGSLSVSDSEQKGTQSSVIIGVPTQPESRCCEMEPSVPLEDGTVADTEVDYLRKITTEGSCPLGQVGNDDFPNFTSETCSDNKGCILNAETSEVKESSNVPSTLVMVNEDVSPAERDLGKSTNCSVDGSVQSCVPVCEENVPKVPSLPESDSDLSLCSEIDGDGDDSKVDLMSSSKTLEAEKPNDDENILEIVFKGDDDDNATLVDEDVDEEEEDSCSSDSDECDTDEDSDSDVSENEDDCVCFENDDDDDGICFSSGDDEIDEVDCSNQQETNATRPHQLSTGNMRGGGFVKPESTNPTTSQCGWDIISHILKRTSLSEDSEEKESDDEDYNCELFSVDLDDSWDMPINGLVISTLIPEASVKLCDRTEDESSNCLNEHDLKVIEELAASGLIIDFGSDSPAENQAEELITVNRKWNDEIDKDWKKETPRKVNFSDYNQTHVADDWCRSGPWEQHARERMNFRRRIEEAEAILRPVFNPVHRWKMYNKLKDET